MFEVKFIARAKLSEEYIAERLAKIVGFEDFCPPFKKDSGYKWQLNGTNDWWMDFNPETREVTLAYRYDHNQMLEGMKKFLEHVFG